MYIPIKLFMLSFEQLEQRIAQAVERLAKKEISSDEVINELQTLFRTGVKKGGHTASDINITELSRWAVNCSGSAISTEQISDERLAAARYLRGLYFCK